MLQQAGSKLQAQAGLDIIQYLHPISVERFSVPPWVSSVSVTRTWVWSPLLSFVCYGL